ncbi:3-keto-5-aminohexanoate cleavage protein [Breoghania sp. L-A4]|uniref:3-keto-5-aminohexanoate cleavage protein n=1 Tax=Breoghania sp. L-A4 TaxID=2304600 RepID=UPI000E35DADA|nr:3-keto-5-aminohexanoate cleavage protein [Breoghania sp. L-A4]AXS40755.1 3-keto-5-aminohexanoate cleavage protein [Breoghania sp. L-A4]
MPTFLTCAVLGNFTTRAQNEHLPITPGEIARDCLAAAEAGAAIVHIHVRDPETQLPSMRVDLYREVVDRIRGVNQDVVINLTTGNGGRYHPSDEDPAVAGPKTNLLRADLRVQHILEIKPDIATLDLNTMVFGNEVVINTLPSIRRMAELIQSVGVRPEIELFDSGDVNILNDLYAEGCFAKPPLCSIVMGIKYGFRPSPETVLYARDMLPKDAIWSAFATGKWAFPMVAQSALAGGNVRIGLEDGVWLARGVKAPSNAAMVEKARRILDELGVALLTASDVRSMLDLRA